MADRDDETRTDKLARLRRSEGGLTSSYRFKLRAARTLADQMTQEPILEQGSVQDLKEAKANLKEAVDKLENCFTELMELLDKESERKAYDAKLDALLADSGQQSNRINACLNKYERQRVELLQIQAQQPAPPPPPPAPLAP